MYRITYIHKDSTTEHPLYIPGDQDYCLTDAQLELEMGKSGELNVYIPEANPAREDIECLTDEIVFYRDGVEIWRGRPVTVQIDFDLTGRLTCEGILSYLYDTYFEPFEFQGSPKELFESIISNHNSHVEARKQFKTGEITVEDNNDYINRSSIYYSRSLEVLTEKLVNDSLGGYFRVRVESDGRYIDYLKDYDSTASQVVEYGSNILDIAEEVEYSGLATAILPLGARLTDEEGMETDEYTTIASVNGGSIYYQDDSAVSTYGWICVCAEWEDVTEPSNLLTKAVEYLEQVTNAVSSFEINAVDLSLISSDEQPINLGDYVMIRSAKHNISQYVELTKMTIHPLAPENDVLQFGADSASITGSQRSTERAVQSALGSLSMRVTNLTADVINAVYGNIEHIIAETVTTDYIEARIADLGYATIEYLQANYIDASTIEANYISANSEWVTNLDAWSANINSLLSGSVGTGELQTIHLTADNVVIDDAVIFDLIAQNAAIGELLAGRIYTDLVEIMDNDDQSLYITGSVIQFKDADGVVRMQIGLDASGYWNYYILDADGNAIFDALGLTEAGLVGNGAIIRNDAVADDAAISGYKLDIQSVTQYLNEYGGLVLEAAQVTIDGNTLEYKLTTMTQELGDISEALGEGVASIEIYYALGDSDTVPPEDGEETQGAVCGEFLCGGMLCGEEESKSNWSLEEPVPGEGEYLWFKHRVEYIDGTVAWTTPTCITSDYVLQHLSTLQTELEVVQGQISATITQVEQIVEGAVETLQDQYAGIVINIDRIEESVRNVTTTIGENYEYFENKYAELVIADNEIRATVSDTQQTVTELEQSASTRFSQIEQTTDEIQQTVISVETSVKNITSDIDDLESELASLGVDITNISGDIAAIQTQVSSNTSQITQLSDEITLEVKQATTELTEYIDAETGEILGALATTTQEVYSRIDQLADSITLEVNQAVSSLEGEIGTVESSLTSKIEMLAGSITLSVTDGVIGSTAKIELSVDGASSAAEIDLTKVREAFANDSTAITISAGAITFASGMLIITSGQMTLDASGNATFSGNLSAPSGTIGGWTIGTNCLYNGCSSSTSTTNGIYLGTSYIRQYSGGNYINITSARLENGNSGGDVAALYSATLRFTKEDTLLGHYGIGTYSGDESKHGLVIDAEYECDYICFGRKQSTGASVYTMDYLINYGVSSYDQRHIFYGDMRVTEGAVYGDTVQISKSTSAEGASGAYYDVITSTGHIRVGITTSNNRGLYDVTNSHWIVGKNSDAQVFLGNTSNNTILYGANVYLNGTTTAVTSDRRLKSDIVGLSAGYGDLIDALTPRAYTMEGETHVGFVVDEVEEAMKTAGLDPEEYGITDHFESDGVDTGAIRYDEIIPILVYEIQKLKKQIAQMGG